MLIELLYKGFTAGSVEQLRSVVTDDWQSIPERSGSLLELDQLAFIFARVNAAIGLSARASV